MDADSATNQLMEARLAEVMVRFEGQLSTWQVEEVTKRINQSLALAATLKATPLVNCDAPEIDFVPYRREEAGE